MPFSALCLEHFELVQYVTVMFSSYFVWDTAFNFLLAPCLMLCIITAPYEHLRFYPKLPLHPNLKHIWFSHGGEASKKGSTRETTHGEGAVGEE